MIMPQSATESEKGRDGQSAGFRMAPFHLVLQDVQTDGCLSLKTPM